MTRVPTKSLKTNEEDPNHKRFVFNVKKNCFGFSIFEIWTSNLKFLLKLLDVQLIKYSSF
jgi:hypothetical protein